jgi:hypothetical protein
MADSSAIITPERRKRRRERGAAVDIRSISGAGAGTELAIPRKVPHLWNDKFTVKLTYADAYLKTVTNSTAAQEIWRMSGIHDPQWAIGGHQPLGRDLYASQYNKYCVLECRYKLWVYNGAVASHTYTAAGSNAQRLGAVCCTFNHSTSSTDLSVPTPYPSMELKNAKNFVIQPESMIMIEGTLKQDDYDVEAVDQDSDTTWIAVGSDPTVTRLFGLNIGMVPYGMPVGISPATTAAAVTIVAQLDYIVQFAEINTTYRTTPS